MNFQNLKFVEWFVTRRPHNFTSQIYCYVSFFSLSLFLFHFSILMQQNKQSTWDIADYKENFTRIIFAALHCTAYAVYTFSFDFLILDQNWIVATNIKCNCHKFIEPSHLWETSFWTTVNGYAKSPIHKRSHRISFSFLSFFFISIWNTQSTIHMFNDHIQLAQTLLHPFLSLFLLLI